MSKLAVTRINSICYWPWRWSALRVRTMGTSFQWLS